MRNPYIVGRWIRGANHYGRQRLLAYLLNTSEPATWVVGTRRMGKTSLLRQLEWLLDNGRVRADVVPLFWDLQGSEQADDFDYELFVALEDARERFAPYGLDVQALLGQDVIQILRAVQQGLRPHGKQLLLLIDEAEALINLAQSDDRLLARLRKTLQSGTLRTVLVATRQLMRLNDLTRHWLTSPFLFGFNLVHLRSLDPQSGRVLVLQEQGGGGIEVEDAELEKILLHCHYHPYLIQYLCYRLYLPLSAQTGSLRPMRDDDLRADQLLSGFFQIDFDHLAPTERQILLTVARFGLIDDADLAAALAPHPPAQLAVFTSGMSKLGYLRRVLGQWSVGNEFLRRWTLAHYDRLLKDVHSEVSDRSVESLLAAGSVPLED